MRYFWDEMGVMERRMDDLVRQVLGPRARLARPTLPSLVGKSFVPAMDVFERDDDLVIRLELPGVDPEEDVQIEVRDHALIIKGERKHTDEVKEEAYYRKEAIYGSFERWILLPETTPEASIRATYVDGVLEVVAPAAAEQTETLPTHRIPIEVGKKEARAA